jgi:phosphatidylserine decarboxylase
VASELSADEQLLSSNLLSTRRRHSVTGTLFVQIGFLEPKDATNQEDAIKKIRKVYQALDDQAHSGRDFLGVLGVPAVCPILNSRAEY